ncbi:RNA methyltransferase [Bacteriovorax sp. DB6_IX]|uniref:TrmH family RNA methyltransferase n=1 Tax=Bacteriovorax sp. DB6_IX TaxID=1353530 RepID=UPI00038A3BC2|nr:RNA methyltransferase [Bacteriovorax sp. DB6_IX]EQC43131.1 RNA methyltransferase, TrmH family [Bacteriovorax sp. DB6_IX]
MIKLDTIDDPNLDEFRNIKDKNLLPQNLVVAESPKVVLKALNSDFKVLKVLCTPEFYQENKSNLDGKSEKIFVVDKKQIESLVAHKLHHGIMALIQIPELSKLDELGERILIFNGVTSPENVGTMTRAAMAFGFSSIIYDYKSASPYLRRCARVSMGNVFEAKVHKSEYLPRSIQELQALGYTVAATANEEGSLSLPTYKYPEKFCLIIGNEGNGMDREVIDACDIKLSIPITSYVAHLNAASAASIFLYHSVLK